MIANDFFEELWSTFDSMNVKKTENKQPSSYKSFTHETFKNGQLTNRIEKVWEDGKLVKNAGETFQIENEAKCNEKHCCKDNKELCKCDDPQLTVKIEEDFVKKLHIIENEVDVLRQKLEETMKANEDLTTQNKQLHEELFNERAKLTSLRDILTNMI